MVQISIEGLRPNKHKCKTCPFNESRNRDVKANVLSRVGANEGSQVCHGTEGPSRKPKSLCRGARDHQINIFYRMGFLEQPTDECWYEKLAEIQSKKR